MENPTAPADISRLLSANTHAKMVTNDPVKLEKLCSTRLVCQRYQKHRVFASSSRKILRMNRALSPYDRMVDMPTRASEKLMNSGERVVLCVLTSVPIDRGMGGTHVHTLELAAGRHVQQANEPIHDSDEDQGQDERRRGKDDNTERGGNGQDGLQEVQQD